MIIRNNLGREFLVRVVFKGERWGREDKLVHDKEDPLIEFYDRTHLDKPAFQPRGQFVTNYRASTLAEIPPGRGLDLMCHEAAWKIDGEALRPVIETAKSLVRPVVQPIACPHCGGKETTDKGHLNGFDRYCKSCSSGFNLGAPTSGNIHEQLRAQGTRLVPRTGQEADYLPDAGPLRSVHANDDDYTPDQAARLRRGLRAE